MNLFAFNRIQYRALAVLGGAHLYILILRHRIRELTFSH